LDSQIGFSQIIPRFWLKPFHTAYNFIPPAKAGGNLKQKKACLESTRQAFVIEKRQ
jgi:hypothetical protein